MSDGSGENERLKKLRIKLIEKCELHNPDSYRERIETLTYLGSLNFKLK